MNINQTFQWLKELEDSKEFLLVEEKTNTIKKISVSKNERGLLYDVEFHLFKILNDKNSKFKIQDNSIQINIKHFITRIGTSSNYKKCNAYIFESQNFNIEEKAFFKYYSKIDSIFLIHIFNELKDEYSIVLKDNIFKISTLDIENSNYLVIECDKKNNFKSFKHYVNNIIVSLGFLTGVFYKKEEFYFHSDNIEFLDNVQFFYRSGDRKNNFLKPFTSQPINYSSQFDEDSEPSDELLNKWSSSIDESTFSDLVKLLIEKPKFYFSIRMLFQFFELSFIARQATLFVVLETITSEINNEYHASHFDKIIIRDEALNILEKYRENLNNIDYGIIENAIDKINLKISSNNVNFEWAFNSLGISLGNADRKLFEKRDEIFHGKIISTSSNINYEEDSYDIEENFISNSKRLYVLISKLILKRVNFSGYILNHSKLFEPEIRESYFLKI
jgi:hypothetical protein